MVLPRCCTLFLYCFIISLVSAKGKPKVLVLIDPFTSYLSGHCKAWAERNGIRCIEAVSEYCTAMLGAEGRHVPESLKAPPEGEEVAWCLERGIILAGNSMEGDGKDVPNINDIYFLSESEAGITTAERMQIAIGSPGNGPSPQLRDKFEQVNLCQKAGLHTNIQALVSTWEEAEIFINEILWKNKTSDQKSVLPSYRERKSVGEPHDFTACILKPNRGVATDGVYLCHTLKEAADAFEAVQRQPLFGSVNATNDHVLVQEYTPGSEEYAVDTVTCQGVTRVTSVWKYDKIEANGRPFIYQSSKLVDVECDEERDSIVRRNVVEYAVKVLKALNFQYGACHIEIKVHPGSTEPCLMEVNARWHAQPFLPIMTRAFGFDSLELTMEALYMPKKFLKTLQALRERPMVSAPAPANFEENKTIFTKSNIATDPSDSAAGKRPVLESSFCQGKGVNHAPPRKIGAGAIVHLVQRESGIVKAIHTDQIECLPSFVSLCMEAEEGGTISVTVDHRTHSGTVVLYADDEKSLQRDYLRLLQLQDSNSIVEVVSSASKSTRPESSTTKRPHLTQLRSSRKTTKAGKDPKRASTQSLRLARRSREDSEGNNVVSVSEEGPEAQALHAFTDRLPFFGRRLARAAKRALSLSSVIYAFAVAYISFLPYEGR